MNIFRVNIHLRRVEKITKGPAWHAQGRFKNYRDLKGREHYLEDADVYHNEFDAARALACALVQNAKKQVLASQSLLDSAAEVMRRYSVDPDTPFCPANC